MLTGKLILVVFLLVDAAYVARIMRREARALRRRMPRWRGPELVYPELRGAYRRRQHTDAARGDSQTALSVTQQAFGPPGA